MTRLINSTPIIYGVSVSPYVRKILVVLKELGIKYQQQETLPLNLLKATGQQGSKDFIAASPLGKIPALKDGDYLLSDSTAILDYIELTSSHNHLFPDTAQQHADMIWAQRYTDEIVQPIVYDKIFVERFVKPGVLNLAGDEAIVQDGLKNDLPPVWSFLNQRLGQQHWLIGSQYTVADIALASMLYCLTLSKVDAIDANQWPHLAHWLTKVYLRNAFKDTEPS